MGSTESYAALETPLESAGSIGPKFLKSLSRLGITTVRELLYHFPVRYEDYTTVTPIADLAEGMQTTVRAQVAKIEARRTWKRRMMVVEATLQDETDTIRAIWFNQPYLKNALRPGSFASFAGRIASGEHGLYLSHPTFELVNGRPRETRHTGRLVPIYPETRGFTSKALRYLIQPTLAKFADIPEWLPDETLERNNFPRLATALRTIHFPKKIADALQARQRFAFEDLFLLQLHNAASRAALARQTAPALPIPEDTLKKLTTALPFQLTLSQKKSLWEILRDISAEKPMNRLLQGDVGSGKTVVAVAAAAVAARNGYQAAFMAPTEVLARQHYHTLATILPPLWKATGAEHEFPSVAFLTGSETKIFHGANLEETSTKKRCAEKIAEGKVAIAVGTHALIQKSVSFARLALLIVDEQHRFGVRQRHALLRNTNDTNTREFGESGSAKEKIIEKDLSYTLNGIFFKTQNELGRFARERQYADALENEFKNAGLEYKRELPIEIASRKSNFADFVIGGKILVECKTIPHLTKDDYAQTMRYLRAANFRLGLLVNFRQEYLKPKRIINPRFALFASDSRYSHRKTYIPHLLSMSATPIPRTLMLSVFGDLDMSLITELPAGRRPIVTKIVDPKNRLLAYGFIRAQIQKGRQAFVICPRIEPSNTNDANSPEFGELTNKKFATFAPGSRHSHRFMEVKTVKEEYEKLAKKIFPDVHVAMLHGQMKPKEKEEIMRRFKEGKTDVLVSTSVIEVGVDVPNATIMMIEGADRFGLAQLYQFRGRVGRGAHQSFCFLFTDSPYKSTRQRLEAVANAKNGFELAEADLKLRGPGEFLGTRQTGLPDIAMRGLQDMELIKASREEAATALKNDPTFAKNPLLREKLTEFQRKIHQE